MEGFWVTEHAASLWVARHMRTFWDDWWGRWPGSQPDDRSKPTAHSYTM